MNRPSGRSAPFHYSAYGLRIESEIELHRHIQASGPADVWINYRDSSSTGFEDKPDDSDCFNRPGCKVWVRPKMTRYTWENFGTAVVRDGSHIVVDPLPDIDGMDFMPFITGALMGHLLHQRGLMVLHGSSMVINGKGVAFLGDKGAGKSTLAVHLHERGHELLSDDLVPLEFDNDKILTYRGFPRIKLWPDSVESLGVKSEELPRISRFFDKRAFECKSGSNSEPVRLEKIFILNQDREVSLAECLSRNAFIELARHTYLNRYLEATDSTALSFRQCEIIAKSIPVYSLNRPHDYGQSSEIASLIEEDLDRGFHGVASSNDYNEGKNKPK